MAASGMNIPILWLMGRVVNMWHLAALTATAWFFAGMVVASISILAGLSAEATERGKIFGLLSLTGSLGSLIGGAVIGPIADQWGYPFMFAGISLLSGIIPVGAFFLGDGHAAGSRQSSKEPAVQDQGFGRGFYLLFFASLLAAVANFVHILGRSLAMNSLGFSASAITSTTAVAGAVALPLPLLIGWLSDRLGRKRFLALCYLAGTTGLCFLAASVSLWHFWLAASLLRILVSVNGAVGPAYVSDIVPQKSLGKGLSLFSATNWIGGIVGYTGAGYAVQQHGLTVTFLTGAVLPLAAIILLIPIRRAALQKKSASYLGKAAV